MFAGVKECLVDGTGVDVQAFALRACPWREDGGREAGGQVLIDLRPLIKSA